MPAVTRVCGLARFCTGLALSALTAGFLASIWAVPAGALIAMVIIAVVIDAAVQFNQITSQRMLFVLPAEQRGRVNALYMTITFFGGAIGSTLATATYHWGGWSATAGASAAFGLAGGALFLTEFRRSGPAAG